MMNSDSDVDDSLPPLESIIPGEKAPQSTPSLHSQEQMQARKDLDQAFDKMARTSFSSSMKPAAGGDNEAAEQEKEHKDDQRTRSPTVGIMDTPIDPLKIVRVDSLVLEKKITSSADCSLSLSYRYHQSNRNHGTMSTKQ